MRQKILKKFQPFIYKIIKWHYRKVRKISKRGIKLKLYPTVFHPTYYLSTDVFLDYLLTLEIENKSVLELGCGNAFTILYLAKHQKIKAFASDINETAIKGLKENAIENGVGVQTFVSDLFDEIPKLDLDFIIINPPYFAEEIKTKDEYAFFTGKDFQYFRKLFSQIITYLEEQTKVLLVLSENVKMDEVEKIALQHKIKMETIHSKIKNDETFFVVKLAFSK